MKLSCCTNLEVEITFFCLCCNMFLLSFSCYFLQWHFWLEMVSTFLTLRSKLVQENTLGVNQNVALRCMYYMENVFHLSLMPSISA